MSEHEHLEQPTSGFHRRAFLRGSSAAAATALAAGPGLAAQKDTKKKKKKTGKVVAAGSKTITLNVNGEDLKVSVENRTTLLEVLRTKLNLTGAKPVAHDGAGGACTVWLDGEPVMASTKLAIQCDGKKVKTVESLGGAKVDAVPMAFVHNDASQCGFCTPGFVVAVRAFLDKNPKATEAEIRKGLNGNLCRCGTYANVIQAALEVVKGGQRG